MSYVEFLRVRRAFYIYAAIVATIVLIIVVSIHAARFHGSGGSVHISIGTGTDVRGDTHAPGGSRNDIGAIPFGLLLGLAGYFSAAFGTVLASSLNRENERGFAFTKPVSRARLALSYMAVDVAAIVAAYAYALLVFCLTPLASLGLLPAIVRDSHALGVLFLLLGFSLLWYGVLQAVTAGYRGRGGKFVGFSWIVFLVLVQLASVNALGPIFHGIVMLLNIVNPFAYVTSISSHSNLGGDAVVDSVFPLSIEARAAITWCLAAAGCAVAIAAWKRVEV